MITGVHARYTHTGIFALGLEGKLFTILISTRGKKGEYSYNPEPALAITATNTSLVAEAGGQ